MTAGEAEELDNVLQKHRPEPGEPANILRTLLGVQHVLGHVPAHAIQPIAEALNVPEADVLGVLSYYPDLHTTPRGQQVVRVCLGEACVANRSPELLRALEQILGVRPGETTKDGRVTLERVYCLGNCGVGPTVMVDETIYGRLSPSELRNIVRPAQ